MIEKKICDSLKVIAKKYNIDLYMLTCVYEDLLPTDNDYTDLPYSSREEGLNYLEEKIKKCGPAYVTAEFYYYS